MNQLMRNRVRLTSVLCSVLLLIYFDRGSGLFIYLKNKG